MEITHIITPIPKRKRDPYGGNTQYSKGLEENAIDLEFDEANGVPTWVAMQIEDNKFKVEELARERPTIFEEESVTIHHAKYDKKT